jgi:hypothetical protein
MKYFMSLDIPMEDQAQKQKKGLLHHAKRHAKTLAAHIKTHHKKYIFTLV